MRRIQPGFKINFSRFRLPVLATLWLVLATPFPAAAQMIPTSEAEPATVEVPENLTRDQARDLVARLTDDQVRELIINQLDKLVTEQDQMTNPAAYGGQIREGLREARKALQRLFTSDGKINALLASIWQQITDHGKISGGFLLFQLIGLLVAGWIAEGLAHRLLQKTSSKPAGLLPLGKRFDLACYGTVMGMFALGAYAAGAFIFVELTSQQVAAAQNFWHQLIWCLVLIKLALLAVRQIVSVDNPDTQLVSVTRTTAQQAWAWSLVLTTSVVLPLPLMSMARDFSNDADTLLLLSIVTGAMFVFLLIGLVIHLRNYGTRLIAGEGAEIGSIRQGFARIWWMLAITYILLIWLMSIGVRVATGESSLVPGLGSLLLFAMIPYFDMGLKWLITCYFEDKEEEQEAGSGEDTSADETAAAIPPSEPVVEADVETDADAEAGTSTIDIGPGYIATALRYARVLMVLAIVAIFLRLWGIDLRAVSALLVGQRFAEALFGIGITILLTWALWGVIRISIERKLDDGKAPGEQEEEAEAGGLGGTRVETILPLIRIFIKITLIVMAVMISLSSLGVDIGPLIAGAGVIGIAIGFGAQTLVRDIVSGFFYLIDDAFRIGEYVVIGEIRGTVEKISIRSFQLRHHNGPVHTIPYGEITSLTNWSRDWAIMKFELRIPFETDIDVVRKVIKQIGIDMFEDPAFGPLMLMPLKSQGVNRMDDSALIIRCKFTSVPGQQYLIRREAFTRIQRVFEEKGIQFAPRRVLVEATTPAEAIKGAAAVLDQEEGKPPPKADNL